MQLGTDDLFHKRKAKVTNDLNRKQAIKRTYEKILIVCEGSKTEPNYFAEAVAHFLAVLPPTHGTCSMFVQADQSRLD